MAKVSLFLCGDSQPTLIETAFEHPISGRHVCVRGKSAGAYEGYGSFQWTSAVLALTALLVQSAAARSDGSKPLLSGGRGSPAASLDYSLSKLPLWLLDMFGTDSRGHAVAQRLFRRSNPERKRPGPVTVSLNTFELPLQDILIYMNGRLLLQQKELEQLCQKILPAMNAPVENERRNAACMLAQARQSPADACTPNLHLLRQAV